MRRVLGRGAVSFPVRDLAVTARGSVLEFWQFGDVMLLAGTAQDRHRREEEKKERCPRSHKSMEQTEKERLGPETTDAPRDCQWSNSLCRRLLERGFSTLWIAPWITQSPRQALPDSLPRRLCSVLYSPR